VRASSAIANVPLTGRNLYQLQFANAFCYASRLSSDRGKRITFDEGQETFNLASQAADSIWQAYSLRIPLRRSLD